MAWAWRWQGGQLNRLFAFLPLGPKIGLDQRPQRHLRSEIKNANENRENFGSVRAAHSPSNSIENRIKAALRLGKELVTKYFLDYTTYVVYITSMNRELTPKQNAIYQYIQMYLEDNHRPPSLRDIGAHFGLSVGTVQEQVEALRKKGFLNKEQSLARGLRLPFSINQIPILGRVHAGPLHAAFEDVEGHVAASAKLASSRHFALRVRGDSMTGAGIFEGDLLIVRIQNVAEEGDIVVARAGDETTVKKFRVSENKAFLEPANPRYQIIEAPFDVLGVVIEVRRQLKA